MEQKPTLESTLKSLDTEEFIDIHFYRPIGYRWALLFNKMGVSPNAVTIASIVIGVAAGICYYPTDLATSWVCYSWCGPTHMTVQTDSWRV